MIDKTDLLDPAAAGDLSEREQEIVEDAQNAGKNLESNDSERRDKDLTANRDTGGIIEQTIDSKAVAEMGQPGGESDMTGGAANLDEAAGEIAGQNKYNR